MWDIELFQTTKIQNFETNSQLFKFFDFTSKYCFRPQRYKILKPIHNTIISIFLPWTTVSDHKDTKFWNQFTTIFLFFKLLLHCFRPQRYKILKPIHNTGAVGKKWIKLFQTTKIQNFETNSQHNSLTPLQTLYCFRPQRYKILKPIHNESNDGYSQTVLFQTTKIQNFETNSQH